MNKIELNRLSQVNNNEQNFLTALNENMKRIQQAINDTLSRTGIAPNQMEQVLDMNGNRIVNVGPAIEPTDVVTKQDIQEIIDAAEAAIARLDGLVEAAKIAVQTYVNENVIPVLNEAVGAAEAAQAAAEAARDALIEDPRYQKLIENLDELVALADKAEELQTILDNMTELLAVADGIANIDAVAAKLTDLQVIVDNMTEILNASTYASQAASSASSAASSASSASTSASNASTSATSASSSASTASTAATTATTKASEAATSATSAAASATQADAAVTAAGASAVQAAGHATNALIWAEGDDEAVEALGGEHSSKRWAEIAGQAAGGIIETTGDSGTLTAEQMALIGPGAKIRNDGEIFTLSNNESSLVYATFINGDVSSDDKMAFKAIYVNTSTGAVNYGTWTKEDIASGGGGGTTYTAGDNITIKNGVISAKDTTYTAGKDITLAAVLNPEVTVVGSPTLRDNGNGGDFSDSSYYTFPDYFKYATDSFELYLAIYPKNTNSNAGIIDCLSSAAGYNGLRLTFTSDQHFQLRVSTDGTTAYAVNITGTTTVPLNAWTYVKVVYDSTEGYKLYSRADSSVSDWVLEGSSSIIQKPHSYAEAAYRIGDNPVSGSYFIGSIFMTGSYIKVDGKEVFRPAYKTKIAYSGFTNTATGPGSLSLLGTSNASVARQTVVGANAESEKEGGTAVGYQARTSGNVNGTAVGIYTASSAESATAVGCSAQASGSFSFAGGYNAEATHNQTVAIGCNADAKAERATAVGGNAFAMNLRSIALGGTAHAEADYAIQIGQGTNSTANTMAVGLSSTLNVQLLNSSGQVPIARLGGDTTSTENEFLKKDGTWASAGGSAPVYNSSTKTLEF